MTNNVRFFDFKPAPADFLADVREGLSAPRKWLPPKYFYDAKGSRLFDAICTTPEYYPTRTETAILRDNAAAIAEAVGPACILIEPGAGSLDKVRRLLDELRPSAFLPIDISGEHLLAAAEALAADYPTLEVRAVCMDYMQGLAGLAQGDVLPPGRRVVFFPGSTIGNFEPSEAVDFLGQVAALVAPDGGLLIGVDLKKDPDVLHRAYNDSAGYTREFNLNLLYRMNGELGADFPPDRFRHYAFYNVSLGRIEMHLVSRGAQAIRLGTELYAFGDGESIHTESSYKYAEDEFPALAERAGLRPVKAFVDPERLFSVHYFECAR
jgi:dimethylhistidine N-methyltransferase